MKPGEKAALYRELAKLVGAGYHLDRAMALLIGQKPARDRRLYLEGLQQGLAEGKGIAAAVAAQDDRVVSGLEKSLVKAGEQSGKLAETFSHLARYFAAVDGASRQSRGAMTYPLVLLHLAILLPELPAAIVAEEGSHPWTRVALMLAALWTGLFLIGWLWRWMTRRAVDSPAIDRLVSRVPFIGKARRHWALARFCQVFHSGLLAALRMSETARLAGEASQSGEVRSAANAAAAAIDSGESLSLALADSGAFPTDFVHTVATAEEAGTVDEEMARRAAAETMLASEAIYRASLWLPKIGYALVVVFVAYRVITMMMGYYSGMLQQLDDL